MEIEKWYCRIFLEGSKGETDIENRLRDMGRGEESMRHMDRETWKYSGQMKNHEKKTEHIG